MAMTLETKKQVVETLVSEIKESGAIYLVDYTGIPVVDDNAFRQELNTKGIKYKAVKNTLLKRALAECGVEGLDDQLQGVTAVAFGGQEAPNAPAKEFVALLKDKPEIVTIKAISLDGNVMGGDALTDVSKMPGREELIASIISIAMGPGANLAAQIAGPGATLAGQVKALEDKLEN